MKNIKMKEKRVISAVTSGIIAIGTLVGCSSGSHSGNTAPASSDPVYGVSAAVSYDSGAEMYNSATYCEPMECRDEYYEDFNTEEYDYLKENSFQQVSVNPLSTFAIDVDTGSYGNLRRMVNDCYRLEDIPDGAIRTEELLNYFDYTVDNKSDGKFSVDYELHACPWNEDNGLLLMTIEANETEYKSEGNNFVFLIDSSGSMKSKDKLPLAVEGFKKLTNMLGKDDRVSIVTYSGTSAVLLDGCSGNNHKKIEQTLESISSGGSTNGGGGIEAAYDCAMKNFIEGGNNRVILASDGDMNVGITSNSGLVELITEKKESGVFLTTLGFGSGNYSDSNMESIADAGNGNYFYIDCNKEAERVLADKMRETTITVAKDVKLQAEFNPNVVSEYRLLGYENRQMAAKDFTDDTKDGGEVGAGQQVTVLYEIVYSGGVPEESELKYQELTASTDSTDILTMSIRYKEPDEDSSVEEEYVVTSDEEDEISDDWNTAAGIALFSMVARNSEYSGKASLDDAYALVKAGEGDNEYRREFAGLLQNLGAK